MLCSYRLSTDKQGFYDITNSVRQAIKKSKIKSGMCIVYCPHTTAAITINENADSDVVKDLLLGLDKAFPNRIEFKHCEGNSHSHLKSSCVGVSQTLIVDGEDVLLGTWQGVYFCEFDGPRQRQFFVKIIQS